jgi:hypothetical protein
MPEHNPGEPDFGHDPADEHNPGEPTFDGHDDLDVDDPDELDEDLDEHED